MIKHDKVEKKCLIANKALSLEVDYSSGIKLKHFSNVYSGKLSNEDREIISFFYKQEWHTSKEFELVEVIDGHDDTRELFTVTMRCERLGLAFRVHFVNDMDSKVNVIIQMSDDKIDGYPFELFFHSPFMANLEMNGNDDMVYYPNRTQANRYGNNLLNPVREDFTSSDVKMPLVVCDSENQYGFSVRFCTLSDLWDVGFTQNRSMDYSMISTEEELKEHQIRLNLDESFNDCFEFEITGLQNGWVEAFDRFRKEWASTYDFSEYKKPDLQWFRDCFVHQFIFLYGEEGFNFEEQKVDVEKILKDGEEFGGYDTVTVWNQYPRLGIDGRNQFEFYNDFPGGREALREMVDKFHDNGVYVFLPYNPWDRRDFETVDYISDSFAQLIRDTDADGFQLDTMNDIFPSVREKLNEVRPGIILTTQKHPNKKHPLELITTSWDELWVPRTMPEMDVFRFVFPEHIAPVTSRYYMKEDKDLLIQRSKFSAAPILVWQDIFGRWLPWNDEQKAEIKAWKEIFFEHQETYLCSSPAPLYPVVGEEIYCNAFFANDGSEDIYSFYSDNEEPVKAVVKRLADRKKGKAKIILGKAEFDLKDNCLEIVLPPRQVVHISVTA